MTRARNAAKGFGPPPPLHHWMEAVLLLCVSLVQGLASTLQMIHACIHRDWHTTDASKALPRDTSDNCDESTPPSQPSFSGKAEGRIPGIPVVSSRGTTTYSPEAVNRDARHKAEHDSMVVAASSGNGPWAVPREGGLPDFARVRTRSKQALPRSCRRASASGAGSEPCPNLQLQDRTRSTTVPGFRRSSE